MKWKLYSLLVLLLVLTPYVYLLRAKTVAPGRPPVFGNIPLEVNGYTGGDAYIDPEEIEVLGSDVTLFRMYQGGELEKVWVFLGYFGSAQEKSQIHSPKNCYPGSGWNIYEEGTARLQIAGRPIVVKKLFITDGDMRQVVFYWFATPSGTITNEFGLKWDQMKNALMRRSLSAVFIRFSADIEQGQTELEAENNLKKFVETILPHFEQELTQSLQSG
jgi:EpsI family protein